MADQLRPYIVGSSPPVGSSDKVADGEGAKQSGESSGSPLLTVSDINSDMLKVTGLLVGWLCVFFLPAPTSAI